MVTHPDDIPGDVGHRRQDGRVVIVGGGPGDPDLITVRGLRELHAADVVVVDRLAPRQLLDDLPPAVEIIDVGKSPLHHPVPQREIEQILVDRARRGLRVVRLKGGDPFLLGRGGEEVIACRAAGVPVTVVPGVTSAFAAPARADIPVTHREVAKAVTVLSGHAGFDFPALVAVAGTIIVLMGMSRLHELSAGLIRAGMAPGTAAAVIHRAFSSREIVVRTDLASIAGECARVGVRNPAVIVIGDVAAGLDVLAGAPD